MLDPRRSPRPHYAAQIEEVRKSERLNSVEFITRTTIILIAAACGWFIMDMAVIPLWLLGFFALVLLEKTLLSRFREAKSQAFFVLLIGLGFAISAVFTSMPVYLWYLGDDIWKLGSAVLLIGGVLNVFLLRARVWQVGLAYMIPISIAFFVIAFDFYMAPSGGASFWSAIFIVTCLTAYFGLSIWEAHRANEKLRNATAQFFRAQKLEALGTLTSGVAHDFNNILAVILGSLELNRLEPDPDEREKQLDEVLSAVLRGKALTKQLLQFSKRAALAPQRILVSSLLEDINQLANRVLPATVNLTVSYPMEELDVYADQSQLFSALLNLIINARDALPDGGGIEVTVKTRAGTIGSPDHILFFVRDNGFGISEEVAPNILDPFFTTKATGTGTGLGLAMVASFAQQSGGTLNIESEAGVGTEACLALPQH
ncbi:MAG: ATP-binding protein [Pseudomonadota bacterium]